MKITITNKDGEVARMYVSDDGCVDGVLMAGYDVMIDRPGTMVKKEITDDDIESIGAAIDDVLDMYSEVTEQTVIDILDVLEGKTIVTTRKVSVDV